MRFAWTWGLQVLVLVLCSSLLALPVLSASPSESATDLVILKQLGELRQEIQALRKEVGQLRDDFKKVSRPSGPPVIPPPKRIAISKADIRILGNSGATVGIVEFTDYQCPFCQRFHSKTFPKLKEIYIDSGKVKFFSRDFPLGNHAEANQAAVATRCAGKQGAFWEMRDELFVYQDKLSANLYEESAKNLHLNMESFSGCLEDSNEMMAVNEDQVYGQSIGITGTPSFFVGRLEGEALVDIKPITGAQSFTVFSETINAFLK